MIIVTGTKGQSIKASIVLNTARKCKAQAGKYTHHDVNYKSGILYFFSEKYL